jgi:hypothetical protein
MPTSLITVFDPEVVIPSDRNRSNLEFWARLEEWTADERPRLGPSTLEGVLEMIEDIPTVVGLSIAEFWKIIGRLVSRGLEPSGHSRSICEMHIRADFTGSTANDKNVNRLLADLAGFDPSVGVVIATDASEGGSTLLKRACVSCDEQLLFVIESPKAPLTDAWRSTFLASRTASPSTLELAAVDLFPNLVFSHSAWSRVGTLSGSSGDLAGLLVLHLGVLNDHAPRIWRNRATTGSREMEFGSLGVEASPEGPRIHRFEKAMKDRTFEFDGRELVCEWHTKLKPNIDRVHFYVENETTYVGAIVDHLLI